MLENERLTQAVVRIAKVQLGITIQEEDLELTTIVHIPSVIHQPEEIAFYFTAKHYEGVIANVRPNKCKELRFFPLTALPQNLLDVQATQNMKEKRMLAP
jgi:8-oxo-dGTP diphosphatase